MKYIFYFNKKKNIFLTRTVEILLADWGVNIGVEIEIEKENVRENEMEIGKTCFFYVFVIVFYVEKSRRIYFLFIFSCVLVTLHFPAIHMNKKKNEKKICIK